MVVLLWMFALVFMAAPATAQIYEWRDSSGDRHFTNDLEDVPEALRDEARIVVRASPVAAAVDVETDEPETTEGAAQTTRRRDEVAPPRQAQLIYDHSFRFARPSAPQYEAAPPAPPVQVNIAGPLAVSQVIVPESPPVPIDYFYGSRIPLGYRPNPSQPRERAPRSSPPSILAPAPITSGSPAYMPANMGLGSLTRSTARRR